MGTQSFHGNLSGKAILFCVFTFLISPYAAGQDSCGNFEPGKFSEAGIKSEFQPAVFRVQVEKDNSSGTGYLIDASNGYILTAAHVVGSAGPTTVINISSPNMRSGLTAKVLKSLPDPIDLALIQIDHPENLVGIRAVDVTFRFPGNDTSLVAMGYPEFAYEPNQTPRAQPVSVMATSPDGSIEVKQTAAIGGASGGPLIDASGSALGTCKQEVGVSGTVARYAPMSLSRELLNSIPISARMNAIDKEVKTGAIDKVALSNLMIKNSSNPTNLELYSWAMQIAAHQSEYSSSSALLRCPIIPALIQRGMDDVVIDLTPFASARDVATANFHVASRELAGGQNVAAITHVQIALTAYRKEHLSSEALSAQLLLAQAQLNIGATTLAASNVESILSNNRFLAAEKRGDVFFVAGMVDEKQGHFDAAIEKYSIASNMYQENGKITKAGDALERATDAQRQKGYMIAEAEVYAPRAVTPEPVVAAPVPQPVAVVQPPVNRKVVFAADSSADSLFDFGKSDVKPSGKAAIDRFTTDLRGADYEVITVTGHTDRIGSHAYNMKLSQHRAEAVKAYMVESAGIPADKIEATGVDGSNPVTQPGECKGKKVTKKLIACLAPDRRVEVEVAATRTSK